MLAAMPCLLHANLIKLHCWHIVTMNVHFTTTLKFQVLEFLGPVNGWSKVDGLEVAETERLFAPAIAVPDSALANCRVP